MLAVYKFRFYELDQPLEVGDEKEFAFFVDPHFAASPLSPISRDMILAFANTLGEKMVVRHRCRIVSISHPTLGKVQSIATRGLSYTVILDDGRRVVVDAEENPGIVEDGPRAGDWLFLVEIEPIETRRGSRP